MTQESQVQTAIGHWGRFRQWSRGLFYRKEAGKETLNTKALSWAGFGLLGITIVVIFINTTDDEFVQLKLVDPPENTYEQITVNVPSMQYDWDSSTGRAVPKGAATSRRSKKSPTFSGPQIVARPGLLRIPPGAVVKAVLASGGSNGPVKAFVQNSFSMNGETLIRSGSTLLGTGSSTEDRLIIRFTRMVTKDGAVQTIQAQALDSEDEQVGIKGSQLGNTALKLAGAVGLNFVGAFSEGFQDTEVHDGVAVKKGSLKNALLNGTARASLDLSKEAMEDLKHRRPVVQIDKGKEILVLFEGSAE